MKKLILIPTALIAGLTPVISLVGCNKSVIDYTVTDQEMQDALLLKGVNYFQQNRSAETTTELVDIGVRTTVQAEADINFAPTVYYNYTQQNFSEPEIITAWTKSYIFKNSQTPDTYQKYTCDQDKPDWQGPTPSSEDEYKDVQENGVILYNNFYTKIVEKCSYTFDEETKSYFAEISDEGGTNKVNLYFLNKRIIKIVCWLSYATESFVLTSSEAYTFAYKEYIPPKPII